MILFAHSYNFNLFLEWHLLRAPLGLRVKPVEPLSSISHFKSGEKIWSQDGQNFFSEQKQVYQKVVTLKDINSSTFKTQTDLWRKKKKKLLLQTN